MTPRRPVRVAAAVLVQAALVLVAVQAPLSARLTGEEVRLRVEPVDPYDPFRGAYVDLGYPDLPDQPGTSFEDDPDVVDPVERGVAYVPLVPRGEVWVGGPVQRTRPADGPYLTCDDSDWRLRCGIESLFLPQDAAAGAERELRQGAVATVRVDGRGNAALLGIEPA
ncbi:GDYXXLXY domain-containing protein [Phycicoccus flavus]|uniref:GDYXXLXY domain-containing protein n=1 Tax=Phycicoccus flavus TaxID=2502783 RepID=A0A8T6R1Q2_9MICO|nr:GDYXXLXY domain-containing protein [Phycicoccus flavus]NHA66735.1 GDYXXLXY domain-containing protein [Phycicoccus flavus]